MAKLQKANLGVPPDGSGGDDQRTANTRFNANVDVLNACVPLGYSVLYDSTTLRPDQVGVRYAVNMGVTGKIVTLPLVSSVDVNACVHLFNVGPQTTIGMQGNDGTQIRTLNTGDWATYIADGGSFWHVTARGRMLRDEIVGGNLSVVGKVSGYNSPNLLINGSGDLGNAGWLSSNLGATLGSYTEGYYFSNPNPITSGNYVLDGSDFIGCAPNVQLVLSAEIYAQGMTQGQARLKVEAFDASKTLLSELGSIAVDAGAAGWQYRSVAVTTPANTACVRVSKIADFSPRCGAYGCGIRRIKLEGGTSPSLYSQEASIAYFGGAPAFSGRPTFAGKVPWDSGNLASPWHAGNFSPANYAALSGAKFTGSVYVNSAGPNVGGSRLVVGASAPEWPVEFNNAYTGSASGGVMLMQACSTATQFAQFFYFSSIVGAITHNGSSVSYNTASDYRLKENIVPVTGATERLMKMRPARFNFINDPNKLEVDGFIAHELQAVVPYAVTGEKDAVEYRPSFVEDYDPEDVQPADVTGVSEVIVPQTVDHSKLVPLLAAALQEAIRRIEALEAKKGM